MSAWTIYWVLQMDQIGIFVNIIGGITGLSLVVTLFCTFMFSEADQDKEGTRQALRFSIWNGLFGVLIGLIAALLPTTKTMCAVLTIPVIVNNKTLQADAVDIYSLGMERIKEVLDADKLVEVPAE